MNHQPFRDWLLSDESLSPDQKKALQGHLEVCSSCNQIAHTWPEVELTFRQSQQLSPAPGFVIRWQEHLEEYLLSKQKHRVWLGMGITMVLVIALLGVSASQVWSFVQSPGEYLAIWFNSLISLIAIFYALGDEIQSVTGYMPAFTIIGMFFAVGLISFLSVLWLATYRKISMARRTA